MSRRRGRPRGRRGVAVREPEAAASPPPRARAPARDVGRRDRRRRGRVRARASRTTPEASSPAPTGSEGQERHCAAGSRRSGREVEAAVVVLADGPTSRAAGGRARTRDVAATGGVVAASYEGGRGHPLVIGRDDWGDIPDEGLRDLPVRLVPCDDLGSPGDVDTREDLERRAQAVASSPRSSASLSMRPGGIRSTELVRT